MPPKRFQNLTVGRELKMIELIKEIDALLERLPVEAGSSAVKPAFKTATSRGEA